MESKQKVITSLVVLFALFFIGMVISTVFNFRAYGLKTAEEKASLTAEIIKTGLTAHMVNGIMSEREFFLQQIEQAENINQLWISRSPTVIKQYGEGFNNEIPRDKIDRDVLKTGKTITRVTETTDKSLMRITIPYEASAFGNPNCMQCHDAKEGETLGTVSMVIDISDVRMSSLKTVLYNVTLTVIIIILIFLLISKFIKPYVAIFYSIQDVMESAYRGDYTKRVNGYNNEESQSVATLLIQCWKNFSIHLKSWIEKFISLLKTKTMQKRVTLLKM